MPQLVEDLTRVALIGIGATGVMDLWVLFLKALKVPAPNFAFVGRWVRHFPLGTLAHDAIARAEPVRHELALGWLIHYAVGIAFAGVLVGLQGMAWT
jgi:hypothetical protein